MNQTIRDALPVLLFLAAGWNGAVFTIFTMLFRTLESRLERIEKLMMEAK